MSTQQPPSSFPPCENCGGVQVGNLSVKSHYHVGLHPTGKQLWSSPLSDLNAVVCLGCGLTKFFAAHLEAVRRESSKHPERFIW